MVRTSIRTVPSPKRKCTPTVCGEPQLFLYGSSCQSPRLSFKRASPRRDVPIEPPRKNGSSQYQFCGVATRGLNAFSPTRIVLDSPSLKVPMFRHNGRLSKEYRLT